MSSETEETVKLPKSKYTVKKSDDKKHFTRSDEKY